MNVFFELSDLGLEAYGHRYISLYNIRKSTAIIGKYRQLFFYSTRVWSEEDTGISFLKHRYSISTQISVDMKEFMWIKLKSINL
jgi:predicted amidohydrolase